MVIGISMAPLAIGPWSSARRRLLWRRDVAVEVTVMTDGSTPQSLASALVNAACAANDQLLACDADKDTDAVTWPPTTLRVTSVAATPGIVAAMAAFMAAWLAAVSAVVPESASVALTLEALAGGVNVM
jgi:hypothetical protein